MPLLAKGFTQRHHQSTHSIFFPGPPPSERGNFLTDYEGGRWCALRTRYAGEREAGIRFYYYVTLYVLRVGPLYTSHKVRDSFTENESGRGMGAGDTSRL